MTSIAALKTALANNSVDEIVVADGMYQCQPGLELGVRLALDRFGLCLANSEQSQSGRQPTVA